MPSDTPLHKAAHNGDKGACLQILEEKSVDVNAPGAGDRRALHRAAGGNHAELCTLLLEKGAEIDGVRIVCVALWMDGATCTRWLRVSANTIVLLFCCAHRLTKVGEQRSIGQRSLGTRKGRSSCSRKGQISTRRPQQG